MTRGRLAAERRRLAGTFLASGLLAVLLGAWGAGCSGGDAPATGTTTTASGTSSSSTTGGGGGAGGEASSSTTTATTSSSSGGGEGGAGGGGGMGGGQGTGGGGTGDHGPGATALVNGGTQATSAGYRMVFTLGQSTQNQGGMTSPGYRMQGGLVGANGSLP